MGYYTNTHINIRQLQRPGKPDLLEKIVSLYMDNSLGLLNGLRVAIDEGNAEQVRMNAHSFKSSSANLGALQLEKLCKQLEDMGRHDELEGAPSLLGRIESEFRAVSVALRHESPRGISNG